MANSISQAVDGQARAGVERLRDTGRLGYRAGTYSSLPADHSLSESFKAFGNASVDLYGNYKQDLQSKADERSNEIIRKLTPEQRRAAIESGTLLYQDDPEAMKALRFKTGRNAAFEVETEIQNKIAEGRFKTAKELGEYRRTRLEDKAKAYAEATGIDSSDEDYQRGFNDQIVARDAAVYDAHARYLSDQTKGTAQVQALSDVGSMFSDEALLRSPHGPATFASYFNSSLASGAIPTEGMAVSILAKSIADNATRPGAEVFMEGIGDQEVNLYGRPVKIKDIVGPEVLDNYKVKAGQAQFERNRDLNQTFQFGLQDALAQSDPHQGLQMLAKMQSDLYKLQPSDMVTQQGSAITAARGHLLGRIKANSAALQEQRDKMIQSDNRMAVYEDRYNRRLAGENVSTDRTTFQSDGNTGKFTEADDANFAAMKLSQIDRMSISQPEKDRLKLQYLNAEDDQKGPFHKHFQTFTDDAVRQYNGLVTADSAEVTEENTARIREFQRIYQSDPGTIAGLYPEQSALAERLSLAERSGISLQNLIDADRRSKSLDPEAKKLQEQKWATMYTGSDSSVPFLPGPLRQAARTIFDAELYRTGDEGQAKASVNSWLDKSAVSFKAKGDKTVGAVQKKSLMVDPQDATSWRQGQEILKGVVKQIAAQRPWLNEGDITITETPAGIVLQDSLGSINMPPITLDLLRQDYSMRKEKAAADKAQRGSQAIDKFKAEQKRQQSEPFKKPNASFGTLEGAGGFMDK